MEILVLFVVLILLSSFTLIPFIRFLQTRGNREFEGEKLIPFSCGKIFSAERYYFNSKGIFVFSARKLLYHYQFEDLLALDKSGLSVNYQKYWFMLIKTPEGTRLYRFVPKDTIFNNNFTQFYQFLKQNHPKSVKGKWYKWFPGVWRTSNLIFIMYSYSLFIYAKEWFFVVNN